jgi:hypothetical protein
MFIKENVMNSKNRLLIALLFGIGFVGVVAHAKNKVKIEMDLQKQLELNEKEFVARVALLKERIANMDQDEFMEFLNEMIKEYEMIKEEQGREDWNDQAS